VSVDGLAGLIARWDAQQARYLPGREELLDRWKDEQQAGAEDYAHYRAALRSEPAPAEDVETGDSGSG
jgi:hypothetical protein